jgi:hypothetical protein
MADLLDARSDGPWRAWIAWGINEFGQISGAITRGLGSHPFIYTPGGGGLTRDLTILPQIGNDITISLGINNRGEICGLYEANGGGAFVASVGGALINMGPLGINGDAGSILNDSGQVAFYTGRYTRNLVLGDTETFEPFPGWLDDINSHGDVVGVYTKTTTKEGKSTTTYTVYRAASPSALEPIHQGSGVSVRINDNRDVSFTAGNRIILFRDGIGGIQIDATITNPNAKWSNAVYIVTGL